MRPVFLLLITAALAKPMSPGQARRFLGDTPSYRSAQFVTPYRSALFLKDVYRVLRDNDDNVTQTVKQFQADYDALGQGEQLQALIEIQMEELHRSLDHLQTLREVMDMLARRRCVII